MKRVLIFSFCFIAFGLMSQVIYQPHRRNAFRSQGAFQPSDVPGLKIWLKSESLSSLALEGGSVSNWPDSSGNNYYFTNSDLAKSPYLTNTFNGQSVSALFFDGTDDWLRSSNSSALAMFKNVPSASLIAVVHVFNTTSSKYILFSSVGGSVGNRCSLLFDSSEKLFGYSRTADGDTAATVGSPTASTVSKALCVQGNFFYTNGTILIYTNNILATNGPGPTTTNNTANTDSTIIQLSSSTVAGAFFFQGMMGEIIAYSPAISDADRNRVFSYLTNKFKITL